jgi:hypothetical protein
LLGYVGDSDADHVPYSFEDWPPQKMANTVLVLQLVRTLTEPDSSSTPINQKVMVQSGILLPIVQLGLCSNAPSMVRTEAIYSIAYVIAANPDNQTAFGKTVVACPPKISQDGQIDHNAVSGIPRPAIVSLISIAVNADTGHEYSYSSRAAATHAAWAFLEENSDAQLVLVSTFKVPPEDNANTQYQGKMYTYLYLNIMLIISFFFLVILLTDKPYSAGSLLLEVIENWEQAHPDPYKVWFACAIMSYAIQNNEKSKEIAGGIVFGEEENGEEPVPLLHHIVAHLLMSAKNPSTNARIPIGYLCLLCIWLYESPKSVSLFLSESTHVQFVSKEREMVNKRKDGNSFFLKVNARNAIFNQ